MLCRESEGRAAVLLGNVKSTGHWDSLRGDGREKEERKGKRRNRRRERRSAEIQRQRPRLRETDCLDFQERDEQLNKN